MKRRAPELELGGVRAVLAEQHRANAYRSPPSASLVKRLDAGEAVVLSLWQVPCPWRRELGTDQYASIRVELDGSLTPVRPLIFVGCHTVGGVTRSGKHAVDYSTIGADGDRSDVVLELDEVRSRVRDPAAWSELTDLSTTPISTTRRIP